MSKFNKDSVGGTITVVVLLSLICSFIVAGASVLLKPTQEEQKMLDKQKNILSVAGLLKSDKASEIKEIYAQNIEAKIVDLASGEYVEGVTNFDAKAAAKDPAQSITIAADDDKASLRTRAKYAEVYLVKNSEGKINQIVLPMYGTGLWSVMHGFVSVEPDGNTIKGITFYEHGETPGLGGEIENPRWQSNFIGKKLQNAQGESAITIGKGASADKEHGIDGLSGATLTSKGVDGTFKYWFSKNAFGPYLTKLKAGAN